MSTYFFTLWNISLRWLKQGYLSYFVWLLQTVPFRYMQIPRLLEFSPTLPLPSPKYLASLQPEAPHFIIFRQLCQHAQPQRNAYFLQNCTGQRLANDSDRIFVSAVHWWPMQSTHGNYSHNPGALLCLLSEINLTYYIISKANGAEGDKCKVNSFAVGPALCYLEEEWWQAQKN